jgi:hypothetical protein
MCDDSDEKQLLVVRQSGTTVINMDSFIMHRSLRYHSSNMTLKGFLFSLLMIYSTLVFANDFGIGREFTRTHF